MQKKGGWFALMIWLIGGAALALHGRAAANGQVIKLSGAMQPSSQVMEFKISPDSLYAVYKADPNGDNIYELFSVPVDGGAPVKLNVPLPEGRSITGFEISPDGSRVIYGVPAGTPRSFDLYSVPVAGPAGASVRLNGPVIDGGNVLSFQFTPDSRYVVYRADQATGGVFELYSVPADGPASQALKLNPALAPGGTVFSFQISPDSSRVVYMADQATDGVLELFSVPLRGPSSAAIKLNPTPVPGGNVFRYSISPDSSRVVLIADLQVDDLYELFSVPITGGSFSGVKLNGRLINTGDVMSFAISPDSRWVVYRADQEIDFTSELYSVPIDGPAAKVVKLNKRLPFRAIIYGFEISPDSRYVVYRIDQRGTEINPLYSIPIQGPAAAGVQLNPQQVRNGSATAFEISPDGQWVAFGIRLVDRGIVELYCAPIAGPADAVLRLNLPLPPGGSVYNFQISADSSRVVYRAGQDSANAIELYSAPIHKPASPVEKLNSPLGEGGNVIAFAISPDNQWVVYTADAEIDYMIELFSAGSSEAPPPTPEPSATASPTPSPTPSMTPPPAPPPTARLYLPLLDQD